MKIAISGKGGVGKTTLSSNLARLWAPRRAAVSSPSTPIRTPTWPWRSARRRKQAAACVPLVEAGRAHRGAHRRGTGQGRHVHPQPRRLRRRRPLRGRRQRRDAAADGHRRARRRRAACARRAPSSRRSCATCWSTRDDVAILDMEAGIEHLGRGTAEGGRRVHRGRRAGHAHGSDRAPGPRSSPTTSASATSSRWPTRSATPTTSCIVAEALGDIPLLGHAAPLGRGTHRRPRRKARRTASTRNSTGRCATSRPRSSPVSRANADSD